MKRSKKAQATSAVGSMVFLIVGVAIAVLVLIFMSSLGGRVYNIVEPDILDIGQTTFRGVDNFTASNSTAIQLSKKEIIEGSLALFANKTAPVSLTKFYIAYVNGTIVCATPDPFNQTCNSMKLNATYKYWNYSVQSEIRGSMVAGFSAQKQTAQEMPVIVLGVIIAIVLAIILGIMGGVAFKGGSGGSL